VLCASLIYLYTTTTYSPPSTNYQDQIQAYQHLLEQSIQAHQQLKQEYSNILQRYQVLLERVGQEQILQKEIPEESIGKSPKLNSAEFSLKEYIGKIVYIKNEAGIYLSGTPSEYVESRTWGRAWEEWSVIDLGDNQYGFKSYWNTYVTYVPACEGKEGKNLLPTSDSAASRWMFENVSTSGFGRIKNVEMNQYLVMPKASGILSLQGEERWEFVLKA